MQQMWIQIPLASCLPVPHPHTHPQVIRTPPISIRLKRSTKERPLVLLKKSQEREMQPDPKEAKGISARTWFNRKSYCRTRIRFIHNSEDFVTEIIGKLDLSDNVNTSNSSRISTLKVYMDVDQHGHTEVIMDVKIQLPQRLVWDQLEVKVDGGTEYSVLPFGVYSHLFPWQLTADGLQKPSALKPTHSRLTLYTNGILKCYGTTRCS